MLRHSLLALLLAIAGTTAAHGALLTITEATQVVHPGETIGWSFTIESDPVADPVLGLITPWLMITSADFVLDPSIPPPGIFTAFITQLPNSNTVIGPDTGNGEVNPWSQTFNLTLMTGIGSYNINDPVDFGKYFGSIQLTFDEYRYSPNGPGFDPSTDTIDVGQIVTMPVSIRIDPVTTSDVPEPGTLLLAGGLLGLLVARRRASK